MSDPEPSIALSRDDAVRALDWYYGCELPSPLDDADRALAERLRTIAERIDA